MNHKSYGLYIHIPFCQHKCPYCDFNTYALKNIPEEEYVDSLCKELISHLESEYWSKKKVETIYWGGGTPSLLSSASLKKIFTVLKDHGALASEAEISLEANPNQLTDKKLQSYLEFGVNRLSMGVQSLNPKILKTLGRKHSPDQVREVYQNARDIGFNNISLDLIFAVPKQELEGLERDIEEYLSLKPEHISCYELTIEKGTPFYQSYSRGVFPEIDNDLKLEMYKSIRNNLEAAGYHQYEVSNFARSGYESVHNKIYWSGGDYLGIGAGAHSFAKDQETYGARWSNIADFKEYIKSIQENQSAVAWQDTLSRESFINERLMLGFRCDQGVSLAQLNDLAKQEEYEQLLAAFADLEQNALLENNNKTVSLTSQGLEVLDSILADIYI